MFWGKLFGKILPSFPWNVESTKIFKKNIFKVPKRPKSVPKGIQTCFRVIFSKKFYAQCSMEGRVFENFQKIFFFKIPKMPKSVPKSIQTCFELVLCEIFRKIFLPSVPWRVEFWKIFKKYIFKIPRRPKSVPKRIQTCFRVIFSKKFNAQCSLEGRVFENFQKKTKNLQNSKNAQNRSQKYPNVF